MPLKEPALSFAARSESAVPSAEAPERERERAASGFNGFVRLPSLVRSARCPTARDSFLRRSNGAAPTGRLELGDGVRSLDRGRGDGDVVALGADLVAEAQARDVHVVALVPAHLNAES